MGEFGGDDGTAATGALCDVEAAAIRYVCEWTNSGIAVAARRCIAALVAAGQPVCWDPLVDAPGGRRLEDPEPGMSPAVLESLPRRRSPGGTAILHSVPTPWQHVVDTIAPDRSIGHVVWETESIPKRWHRELVCVDELWVPTRWNRDTMINAGITIPVHVVPHAIAAVEPSNPPLELPDDHTVFVLVTAWDWRKRPDLAILAFLEAFTAEDPVTLVVKTSKFVIGWPATGIQEHTWWQLVQLVKRHPRAANIVLVIDQWSDEQIAGLLQRADCFLSLPHSEGWGLGAFDAACLGTPVIITGYGGQLEWLGEDYPGLVPYTMTTVDHPDRSLFEPSMRWAKPDHQAAVEMIRDVAAGAASPLYAAAAALRPVLNERYSLQAVGVIARAALDG